jgi:hypothetical protein
MSHAHATEGGVVADIIQVWMWLCPRISGLNIRSPSLHSGPASCCAGCCLPSLSCLCPCPCCPPELSHEVATAAHARATVGEEALLQPRDSPSQHAPSLPATHDTAGKVTRHPIDHRPTTTPGPCCCCMGRAAPITLFSCRRPRLRAPLGDMRTRSLSTHSAPDDSTRPTQYLLPFTLRTCKVVPKERHASVRGPGSWRSLDEVMLDGGSEGL